MQQLTSLKCQMAFLTNLRVCVFLHDLVQVPQQKLQVLDRRQKVNKDRVNITLQHIRKLFKLNQTAISHGYQNFNSNFLMW